MQAENFNKIISKYKNIIFDYGGIFVDIDYQNTTNILKSLSSSDIVDELYSKHSQIEFFSQFETGKISADVFLQNLCEQLGIDSSKKIDLKAAWNAMLFDIKKERINYLKEIKKTKRIFMLSNINSIHEEHLENYIQENNISDFYNLFEKVYFSHHIGLRKPNPEIFELVLKENNLLKEETLFIDDSIQHINSANEIGIHAIHLDPPNTFIC